MEQQKKEKYKEHNRVAWHHRQATVNPDTKKQVQDPQFPRKRPDTRSLATVSRRGVL
jgi:hypothetical protein